MVPETTISEEADILEECQTAIGYRFRQPEILRSSLTHASGANTPAWPPTSASSSWATPCSA